MPKKSSRLRRNILKRPLNPTPAWDESVHEFVTLWHGCTEKAADSILTKGVNLSRATHGGDFGPGFYTTTDQGQAQRWAWGRHVNAQGKRAVVVKWKISRFDLVNLELLCFVRSDFDAIDYWSFVSHCRCKGEPPYHAHPKGRDCYDVVYGPVSGFWEQREAILGSDQLSFHTERAIALLNKEVREHRVETHQVKPASTFQNH